MARIDLISSIVVMVALALGSLIMLLFTVFMLHGETVHLVKLGGNVVSDVLYNSVISQSIQAFFQSRLAALRDELHGQPFGRT